MRVYVEQDVHNACYFYKFSYEILFSNFVIIKYISPTYNRKTNWFSGLFFALNAVENRLFFSIMQFVNSPAKGLHLIFIPKGYHRENASRRCFFLFQKSFLPIVVFARLFSLLVALFFCAYRDERLIPLKRDVQFSMDKIHPHFLHITLNRNVFTLHNKTQQLYWNVHHQTFRISSFVFINTVVLLCHRSKISIFAYFYSKSHLLTKQQSANVKYYDK